MEELCGDFIPAINPEISSLQFPVLYFTNEYNKIMQLSPIAVIMIFIIRVATFFGILKTIFVMILSKSNSKKIIYYIWQIII